MLRQFVTLIAITLLPLPLLAQDAPWYEVEIYLFSHTGHSIEQWADTVSPVKTTEAVDFISPQISSGLSFDNLDNRNCSMNDWAIKPNFCQEQLNQTKDIILSQVPVTIAAATEQQASVDIDHILLADSQSQFASYIAKLSQEPEHQPLLHMTWQQTMQPRHSAQAIRIFAGKDYAKEFHLQGTPIKHQQFDILQSYGIELDRFTPAVDEQVWQLDGKINIYLNHYLYVETELNYRTPATRQIISKPESNPPLTTAINSPIPSPDTEATQQEAFLYAIPMKQSRRVRSGEVHYLDHPNVGIIIQIRKMAQPMPQAEIDSQPAPSVDLGSPLKPSIQ